ncbi:hypothetical protein [Actinomadura hibisca]|uniref:hypothetical protein n=1 Tax=Actinomadura hibisca TaxID=68565 RepID=UPI000834BAD5|nr:hypothetical protein [Actinomadura hibisca]
MRANKKTVAAGVGAASLLGLGLYLAVPAAANPSPAPSPSASERHDRANRHPGDAKGKHKLARWGQRGVHGEATVKAKDGKFTLRTWQRGQLTAKSGATLTVKSEDGVTWQWTTDAKTRVGKKGAKSSVAALATGDRVIVVGQRDGNTRTAKLVRAPKK